MRKKWWEGNPANENALTIKSMRRNWKMLKGNGTGITIYETPSGIFRAEEEPNGTLIRLERIENCQ